MGRKRVASEYYFTCCCTKSLGCSLWDTSEEASLLFSITRPVYSKGFYCLSISPIVAICVIRTHTWPAVRKPLLNTKMSSPFLRSSLGSSFPSYGWPVMSRYYFFNVEENKLLSLWPLNHFLSRGIKRKLRFPLLYSSIQLAHRLFVLSSVYMGTLTRDCRTVVKLNRDSLKREFALRADLLRRGTVTLAVKENTGKAVSR